MTNYRFERLHPGNMPHLLLLFQRIFGHRYSLDYLLKKYNRPALSDRYYAFLVFDGELAVAHCGAIPYMLQQGEQTQLSSQLLDVMILESHRGQGIFTELNHRVYEALRVDGIASVFGMPNQSLAAGLFKGMKWQEIHPLRRYHVPVQSSYTAKMRYYASRMLRQDPYDYFSAFATQGSFVSSLEEPGYAMTERDEELYAYKRAFGKSFFIEINGRVLWLKISKYLLLIGDMECPASATDLQAILQQLRKIAWPAGIREITFQSSPGTQLEGLFASLYPAHPSWVLGCLNFSSNWDLNKLRCTHGDYDTF